MFEFPDLRYLIAFVAVVSAITSIVFWKFGGWLFSAVLELACR